MLRKLSNVTTSLFPFCASRYAQAKSHSLAAFALDFFAVGLSASCKPEPESWNRSAERLFQEKFTVPQQPMDSLAAFALDFSSVGSSPSWKPGPGALQKDWVEEETTPPHQMEEMHWKLFSTKVTKSMFPFCASRNTQAKSHSLAAFALDFSSVGSSPSWKPGPGALQKDWLG